MSAAAGNTELKRARAALALQFPGVAIAALVAAAALLVSREYGGPVMLFALLLGMALNLFGREERTQAGIQFCGKTLLRIGVALLGARIGAQDIATLGAAPIALVFFAVLATIVLGAVLGRLMGLGAERGVLTGGATAICGASAALAISAALPDRPTRERDTLFTIIAVTTLSTVAMVLYPLITRAFGLSDVTAGVVIGGSIHDVAQVVGAGYTISEEAGDTATLTKLFRVALLAPVVLAVALVFAAGTRQRGLKGLAPPPMLLGFLALATLNSLGLLPAPVVAAATALSTAFLVIAVAAIGLRTNLADLRTLGWKPLALVIGETGFLLIVLLVGVTHFL